MNQLVEFNTRNLFYGGIEEYTEFARSGRVVSRIWFGAMGLNCAFGQFDEQYLINSVLRSLEQGVNFIDTARTYWDSFEEIRKRHRWPVNLYEGKYFPQEGEEVSATGFKTKRA